MLGKTEPAIPAGESKLAGHLRGFSLTAHSVKGADPGMQSFGAASVHLILISSEDGNSDCTEGNDLFVKDKQCYSEQFRLTI